MATQQSQSEMKLMFLEASERKIETLAFFFRLTKVHFRFHTELWDFTDPTNNGTWSNYTLEDYAFYPMLFEVDRNFCRK